jgi:hypothetical protein
MLPPFIIEQIRQREQRERERREERQPRLELPIERFPPVRRPAPDAQQDEDEPNRGIIIVDLG